MRYIYADLVNGCQSIAPENAYDYDGVVHVEKIEDMRDELRRLTEPTVFCVGDDVYALVQAEYGIQEDQQS